MSAVFVWNSIVLLQRQGKDCVSMKWAIDLYDEVQLQDGNVTLHGQMVLKLEP